MNTKELWDSYNNQIYFFILKKTKDKDAAYEVLQNSFLKIHTHIHQLKNTEKLKAWMFQIVRNEIINYFNHQSKLSQEKAINEVKTTEKNTPFCCFDRFLTELPVPYKSAIELVFIKGKKQQEAAEILAISLANLKARIRRGKSILKDNYTKCCKFQIDKKGMLIGESNCSYCES